MNKRFRELLELYKEILTNIGAQPICHNGIGDTVPPWRIKQLEHACWMTDQMLNPTDPKLAEKFKDSATLNRWLGFVQGLLVANALRSITKLREETRQLSEEGVCESCEHTHKPGVRCNELVEAQRKTGEFVDDCSAFESCPCKV